MDKNELIAILEDWNLWKKPLDTGVPRVFYLEKLKKMLSNKQVIIITGARRSGKSFILKQLAEDLVKSKINKNRILIVNFEDPRFVELNSNLLQEIYETYLEFLNPQDKPYIFLDEVQEVEKWEKWVRTMHELKKANIVLSGSNAKLLSKELATLLTGRHLNVTVFPLSFREFLQFNGLYFKDKLEIISKKIEIKRLMRNYLEFGSFPEVVLRKEKKEILLTYFEDVLNKDLVKRYKIRKSEQLKALIKFYFSNPSSLVTFNSLEKFLKISADTIEKFSNYLESAYLIFFLKRFSFRIKEQEKSPKKVYSIDTGLINTVGFRFSQNLGKLAENIVFLELKRRTLADPSLEFYYWKDERHKEVDFVVKEKLKVSQLLQVCWNLEDEKTKKREIDSLLKAMSEFKLDKGLIITEDYEGKERVKNKEIKFLPLWKWLLE